MSNQRAGILGTGHSYPEGILTNDDLAKLVETSDEWITTRTGIKQRRKAAPGEYTSMFAVRAGRQAIERARLDPSDIDLLICATVTPDQILPSTGCIIQAELACNNAAAMDVVAACSGFLYALTTGAQMVASGAHQRVVVVGADLMSSIIDPLDRTTAVLFGDGAGAVLLERAEPNFGILDFYHRVDGSGRNDLLMPAGGSLNPPSLETVTTRQHFLKQNGKVVFKFAVSQMVESVQVVLQRNGLTPADVALLVPHQANQRILDAVGERLGLSSERVASVLACYGNTTGATLPLALDAAVRKGKLKRGDLMVFAAVGAGFTAGATLVRWA